MPRSTHRFRRAERGVSPQGVFLFFFVIFWIMVLGNKVGAPYWNAHVVHEDIVRTLDEQAALPSYDVANIRMAIYNRGQVDNISIPPDTVNVEIHDDNSITVTVPYIQNVPLWTGATLVLNLPQTVSHGPNKAAAQSLSQ